MTINAYSATDSRSRLADWIELSALSATNHSQTREQFIRATASLDEPAFDAEDEDLGDDEEDEIDGAGSRYILDERLENLADRALSELEYRIAVLGENYPFHISGRGTSWKLLYSPAKSGQRRFAQYTYVACLLVSAIKFDYLSLHNLSKSYKAMAEHFQLLAFLVAPEILGGKAYWMGWPRPDKTVSLRDALTELSSQMDLGELHTKAPAWNSAWAKDGTVDLVVWKPFVGRSPGSIVLYGQVASGKNWRTKPLRSYIDPYFTEWFSVTPSRDFLQSMFIPFPLHDECKPKKSQSFDALARSEAIRDERIFGLVIDRLRMTDLAAQSYSRLKSGAMVQDVVKEKLVALFRWRIDAEKLAA
ncbi:hypothetical protein [Subtercola sp. Z020]|uniref:hypothetical protein n=1 Tax=Subtercola sp. Z020 TaxID=2080582 RepID=UPI0011B07BE2|nr:hypothetical protein [Subtercola sp. Z020]